MVCLCSLQPHSKKQLHARDVMEFPWEKEESGKMSAAEIAERFEAAKKRLGLK